jgi:hypothetical protein
LGLAVACYVASFSLPVRTLKPGIDASIWYAANTYRDYGLEMGEDLVHVFGPLGWLAYPIAGFNHLLPTFLASTALQALFLASLVVFALRRRASLATSLLLLVCSIFFFADPQHLETMLYGILLTWWILDLAFPWTGFGLLASAVSAVFAFAKFNMAATLTPLLCIHCLVSMIPYGRSWRRIGANLTAFLVPALVIAASTFSSPSPLLLWIRRSMDIAAGNSEAMSILAPGSQVVLALVEIGIIVALGILRGGQGSRLPGVAWLSLVSVPVFFEFKHGFVRADGHVYAFFTLAAVVAATRLLLDPPRCAFPLVIVAVLAASIGPGVTYAPITPAGWVQGLRLEGVRMLAHWREFEHEQVERDHAMLGSVALSDAELHIIGNETVELIPHDVTPLIGTSLRWRPSPYFQHILIRSLLADSINARHLGSPNAAEFVVWTWHDQDGVHPMDRCPLTHRAFLDRYRLVSKTGVRLLLRRGAGGSVRMEPLGSLHGSWGSRIEIPASPHMVVATVAVKRSTLGRLLRILYRVPPAYVAFDDGTERRFIPTTAAHGLVVSREPLNPTHFRHLLEKGLPHPLCPSHRTMCLSQSGRGRHFVDEVRIEFFALATDTTS